MGLGQKILTQVGFGQFFVARVGFWVGKFPLKITKFSICWVKKYWAKGRLASYLLQVKSKLGSGQGPSLIRAGIELSSKSIY